MRATLANLVRVRSALAEEVLAYLNDLARRSAELPPYYPPHLQTDETGKTRFDNIRQIVQIVEDRSAFEKWVAEERERLHRAGQEFDRLAYKPARSRDEEDDDATNRDRFVRDCPAPPPMPWDEQTGERFKRAVILGDPGFGKTWLLRYEARRLARIAAQELYQQTKLLDDIVLPISVRLSELNSSDDPIEKALIDLATERAAQAMEQSSVSEAFRQFVRTKLETDRCVILLDAWDEVPVEIPTDGQPIAYLPRYRQRLGQRLEAFALKFARPRILMTSRIVGYSQSPILQAKELELLAFDTPQIESFVQVWFGDDENSAHQFLTMLRTNHQVRGLARIPLMLALMCRAFQEEQLTFPTRRVELYDRCLRGLLRDWKVEDKGHEEGDLNVSDGYVEAMIEMLSEIGYALFAEGYEQFDELLLREKIKAWLDQTRSSHELAGRTPASLIAQLKRDGLLVTVSEAMDKNNDQKKRANNQTANKAKTILIFLHRTFQEYLTAKALATRLSNPADASCANAWTLVEKKSWDPKWQEVILLLAGQLDDAGPLLRRLSQGKDDYFHHRLALAALCLPHLSLTARNALSADIDRITTEVFAYWWEHKMGETTGAVSHLTQALTALATLDALGAMVTEMLLAPLIEGSRASDESAIEALGAMGAAAATPEVLTCLVERLPYKREPEGRSGFNHTGAWYSIRKECTQRAVKALGAMGAAAATPVVLTRLLELLQTDSYTAVEAFGVIGAAAATPAVLAHLYEMLLDEYASFTALEALSAIGAAAATPAVLTRLYEMLLRVEGNDSEWAKDLVVETIGRLGRATPAVLTHLVEMSLDEDAERRDRALKALGGLGVKAATPDMLAHLHKILFNDLGSERYYAARTLATIGTAAITPALLPRLLELVVQNENYYDIDCIETICALGAAAATPEVLTHLIEWLYDEGDYVRSLAVNAFSKIGAAAATPTVLSHLLELSRNDRWEVRGSAIKSLGGLGSAAAMPEVLARLIEFSYEGVESAIETLGMMGEAALTPEVLRCLFKLLQDGEYYSRSVATQALKRLTTQMRIFEMDEGSFQIMKVEDLSR